MNSQFRTSLPGTDLDYFDAEAAVNALTPVHTHACPIRQKF